MTSQNQHGEIYPLDMKKIWLWLGIVLVIVVCGLTIYGYSYIKRYQALTDDEPAIVLSPNVADITYCTMGGTPLKMDLYFPADGNAPWQVLVYAHGGSFTGGDKRQGSGVVDIPAMMKRGFAVAAINYRLMPDNPFPAEVIDAKCAVRFLRAHAEEYRLKTEKIGIWGGSAGGHLAAMVGLTTGKKEFDQGEYLDRSSAVDAVVEMFGPTDLTAKMGLLQNLLLRRAFGTADPKNPILAQASPVRYVTPNAPPFLIFHGNQDGAVPMFHAQILQDALVKAGVNSTLVIVKNANHNFKPTGGVISPTREEISSMMAVFFERWLGK